MSNADCTAQLSQPWKERNQPIQGTYGHARLTLVSSVGSNSAFPLVGSMVLQLSLPVTHRKHLKLPPKVPASQKVSPYIPLALH